MIFLHFHANKFLNVECVSYNKHAYGVCVCVLNSVRETTVRRKISNTYYILRLWSTKNDAHSHIFGIESSSTYHSLWKCRWTYVCAMNAFNVIQVANANEMNQKVKDWQTMQTHNHIYTNTCAMCTANPKRKSLWRSTIVSAIARRQQSKNRRNNRYARLNWAIGSSRGM